MEGWIESVGRVEQFPLERQQIVLLNAGKYAEINRQMVVEGFLIHIEFGDIVFQAIGLYHRLVVDHSYRSTITAGVVSTSESDVMVLDISRPGNSVAIIGRLSSINDVDIHLLRCLTELITREHLHLLENRLEADVSVIGNLESSATAFLGRHLNDTRSTTATILSRFGGIFQNGETLDVGWIDGDEGPQVAGHAVDNHQRVVTTRKRCGSSHAYGGYHSLLIAAIRNLHTCRLSIECIE